MCNLDLSEVTFVTIGIYPLLSVVIKEKEPIKKQITKLKKIRGINTKDKKNKKAVQFETENTERNPNGESDHGSKIRIPPTPQG